MDITIRGIGSQDDARAQVDPTHDALRVQVRPTEHVINNQTGGHYGIVAYSGTIAASLAANSIVFGMRWGADNKFMVLKKVLAWMVMTTTPGTLSAYALELCRATGWTSNFSANNTTVSIGTGGKMRTANMAQSAFSSAGSIMVCTTAGMTGQTYSLDTNGFATGVLNGTDVSGFGGNIPLYDENEFGQHPLVLGSNEGFVVRNPIAFAGSATIQAGFQALWTEVAAF